MQDVITVSCSALPDSARVIGFHGTERISKPYSFAIDMLVAHTADVSLDDADGEKLSLTFDRGDGRPPLRVHGIVAALELLHDVGSGGIWCVHLAPRLWQLSLNRRSCIFVEETIPKIVRVRRST